MNCKQTIGMALLVSWASFAAADNVAQQSPQGSPILTPPSAVASQAAPVAAPSGAAATQGVDSGWQLSPHLKENNAQQVQQKLSNQVPQSQPPQNHLPSAAPVVTQPVPQSAPVQQPATVPAQPPTAIQQHPTTAHPTDLPKEYHPATADDDSPVSSYGAALAKLQRQTAFNQVMHQAMPLTPKEITRLKYLYSLTQRASAATPGGPPQPTSTTEMVNLSPGAVPPIARLSQGFVTSIVFVDATGAPWPIEAYDLGDPGAFNIQWDKMDNILMVQALKSYTYGNLAVKLKDLNTPVMVTLIPGQKVIDYRVDMRLQQYGPEAKELPGGTNLPGQANRVLLGILDGIPPKGAKTLRVQGGTAQAWLLKDKIFLRTPLTLISPGWISSMASGDGTHAYELQRTPTLLVSDQGDLTQLSIQGF